MISTRKYYFHWNEMIKTKAVHILMMLQSISSIFYIIFINYYNVPYYITTSALQIYN